MDTSKMTFGDAVRMKMHQGMEKALEKAGIDPNDITKRMSFQDGYRAAYIQSFFAGLSVMGNNAVMSSQNLMQGFYQEFSAELGLPPMEDGEGGSTTEIESAPESSPEVEEQPKYNTIITDITNLNSTEKRA